MSALAVVWIESHEFYVPGDPPARDDDGEEP